ncbi:46070_t:CDS:2, partial [Gigaspora margarita]
KVRYAVDEEDLICWFISGLKELCHSKSSFSDYKKYFLAVENKEEIVRIKKNDKNLQQNSKSLDKIDIDNIDHKTEAIKHIIRITNELEEDKSDKVENSSDGLLDWLTIIGNGYLEKYDDKDILFGNIDHVGMYDIELYNRIYNEANGLVIMNIMRIWECLL